MKKFKVISNLVVGLMLVSIFSACSSAPKQAVEEKPLPTAASSTTSAKKIRVGVSLPNQQEDRWIRDMRAIQAESEKLGMEFMYESADNSAEKQEVQTQNMINKGIDVLILIPNDVEKAAAIIEKAHAKKVKVISYDRLIYGADVDLYLSFDNEKVGALQAEALVKAAPSGNYIVLSGSPKDSNSKYLLDGAMKVLQPSIDSGKIKVVKSAPVIDWNPVNATNIIKQAIQEKLSFQAILAPNDGSAGGAVAALQEAGIKDKIYITGQDAELAAAKRIVNGTQLMTVFKDTRLLGTKAAQLAFEMGSGKKVDTKKTLNNKKIDVPSVLLEPAVVDIKNLDSQLIESGYLSKESVYSKN